MRRSLLFTGILLKNSWKNTCFTENNTRWHNLLMSTWQLRRYVYNLEDDTAEFLVWHSFSRWPRFLNWTTEKEYFEKNMFLLGEVVACKLGVERSKIDSKVWHHS